MRRNVKIALLLSCAWMFAFVYYYHTSRDTKVRYHSLSADRCGENFWISASVMIELFVVDITFATVEFGFPHATSECSTSS
ncbi:hypothetical protein ALC56_02002 [Trachymyrmex septentrionalis]|uniref:Uncharacterized protein n=1 Tax=Trachymyrmex septentrionalis TaxID=34720 RepID=A0A195FT17_9HYME|nr:hypothetical protein ALC56_02002 [Trachymyrmex septentrionalis]